MDEKSEIISVSFVVPPYRSIGVERWMDQGDIDELKKALGYYPVQRAVAVRMTEEQLSDMRDCGNTDVKEIDIADMAICNAQVLHYALSSEEWPDGISVPERVKTVLDTVLSEDPKLRDLVDNGWPAYK